MLQRLIRAYTLSPQLERIQSRRPLHEQRAAGGKLEQKEQCKILNEIGLNRIVVKPKNPRMCNNESKPRDDTHKRQKANKQTNKPKHPWTFSLRKHNYRARIKKQQCVCVRACLLVCVGVCVLRYCSVPTCGGVKSRWWGGRRCSDLGAPRGEMIKRLRGAGKGGNDAQTQPHSSSKHSSDSIHYKCVPLYCQHRKMVSEDPFPHSLQELSIYLKVVKENQCPSLPSPVSLPHTLPPTLSVPCGGVVIEITVCLSGSDNRYPGATGTWCLIN